MYYVRNCDCCGIEVEGCSPPSGEFFCIPCDGDMIADQIAALADRADGTNGPGWTAETD
jgi:hypothetical protein